MLIRSSQDRFNADLFLIGPPIATPATPAKIRRLMHRTYACGDISIFAFERSISNDENFIPLKAPSIRGEWNFHGSTLTFPTLPNILR